MFPFPLSIFGKNVTRGYPNVKAQSKAVDFRENEFE